MPGLARGHHGQFARLFVERRGHGEHDVLLGERACLARLSHASRNLREEARRDFDRRQHAAASPGESQGRILAVRSTSGFESQDLAECTSLVGTSAPCSRA